MTDRRGNQTGHELDLPDDQGVGDLYNPGYSPRSRAPRSELVDIDAAQDISDSAKVTLGKYLSSATKGKVGAGRPNTFQVPGPRGDLPDRAISAVDINASIVKGPIAAAQLKIAGRTDGTFLDVVAGNDPIAAIKFEMTSAGEHGSLINPFQLAKAAAELAAGAAENLSKVAGSSDVPSEQIGNALRGSDHGLLLDIKSAGNGGNAELGNPSGVSVLDKVLQSTNLTQPAISSILKNNRFSQAERAFVQNHERTGTGAVIQPRLGTNTVSGGYELSEKDLSLISAQVISRAAGTNGKKSSPDRRATGGPVVSTLDLRASQALEQKTKYAASNLTNEEEVPSYGSLYTPDEPYEGDISAETAYEIVATSVNSVIDLATYVRDLVKQSGTQNTSSTGALLIRRRGANISSKVISQPRDPILTDLGIPNTEKSYRSSTDQSENSHDWFRCFLEGLSVFYGTYFFNENSKLSIQDLPIGFKDKVASAPGYYVSIARNALRTTRSDIETQEGSQSSSSSGAGETSQNRQLISTLVNSSAWKFVIAMISLGYRIAEGSGGEELLGLGYERSSLSTIHDSRDEKGLIPWRLNLSGRSAFILPASLTAADEMYAGAHTQAGRVASPIDAIRNEEEGLSASGRVSAEKVREIEDRLEGEYVPFYFQDLRTNEILAFHAFLTDLSDGFTANYNSTSGYGRADDVMVYNGTKRAISFGFSLVATSESDHDFLYWNLNKLVSMLYPQYSKGRVMASGENRFVQPFSQIPTASPMIRLRIGDIIKGNYSKFGLARLFGLGKGSDSFRVQTAAQAAEDDAVEETRRRENAAKAAKERQNRIYNLPYNGPRPDGEGSEGEEVVLRESVGAIFQQLVNAEGVQISEESFETAGFSAFLLSLPVFRNRRRRFNQPIPINVTRARVKKVFETPSGEGDTDPPVISVTLEILEIYGGTRRPLSGEELGSFKYIQCSWPKPTPSPSPGSPKGEDSASPASIRDLAECPIYYTDRQLEKFYSEALAQANQENPAQEREFNTPEAVKEFFDAGSGASGNPIVRSFESTRGRGLAGFITDLKMDWGDSTWEIKEGSRAPIMMKLSLSFSPIHDIPMGLDSDGAMRSVAYGVGPTSRSIGKDPYDD